jgi:hypothetical protein
MLSPSEPSRTEPKAALAAETHCGLAGSANAPNVCRQRNHLSHVFVQPTHRIPPCQPTPFPRTERKPVFPLNLLFQSRVAGSGETQRHRRPARANRGARVAPRWPRVVSRPAGQRDREEPLPTERARASASRAEGETRRIRASGANNPLFQRTTPPPISQLRYQSQLINRLPIPRHSTEAHERRFPSPTLSC